MSAIALAACGDGGPGPVIRPGVISLAVGEGRTLTSPHATTIEISGGSAGGEFVLIPFYASQTASATVALEFSGTELSTAAGPPTPQLAPGRDPLFSRVRSEARAAEDASFHAALRHVERQLLARRSAAAREDRTASMQALRSASAAVPSVGDQMTLNVNAKETEACSNPDLRTGTVMAVTQFAVVVADNGNPPPPDGFTPEEYTQIGQEFDAIVHPVVTRNFGTAGDIDNNQGRSVIFYTRAVNEMTPAGSETVISGFFHGRDLFPKTATDPNAACPTSNVAEMFYMSVPDPNGVAGARRSKETVRLETVGVLGHEYQHLINASYRINNNRPGEEVWLNEGLSHVAEELLFYSVSGLGPRQNITRARIGSSQATVDAFLAYQADNFGRLLEFIEAPETHSPFGAEAARSTLSGLATRGSAWQLLRYAADRSTTPEETLWRNLTNSSTAGIANFAAAFRVDFFILLRDWAVAQYTDDAGFVVGEAFQHRSWDFRSIFPAFVNNAPMPLKTRALVAGTPLSLSLRTGGGAYLRFGVAGGATGRITPTSSGAAPPAAVSFTVVRTR